VNLDLDVRHVDMDLTISESVDLDYSLEGRGHGLGLATMGLDYISDINKKMFFKNQRYLMKSRIRPNVQ